MRIIPLFALLIAITWCVRFFTDPYIVHDDPTAAVQTETK